MKPVKLGFIGIGGIARAHLRALANVEEIEVVACADIVPEILEKSAKEWGIPHTYLDYKEMLKHEDIEAVSVCTPNQAHAQPTIDALKAGKHVMVEKPMAATLKDAIAMTKAAHESDKILMVALKSLYEPRIQAAKAIADSGVLGDVYYCETVAARRAGIPEKRSFLRKDTAGIGTVADIGVYCLEEALHILGHPKPVAVSGIANNYLGTTHPPVMGSWKWVPEDLEVEDFGVAWVRFENGMVMVFKTCWIMHMDTIGPTFFLGTKAGLKLSPLTVFRHEWGLMTDTIPQNVPSVDGNELFRRENVAFARAIREGLPSPIPADDLLITNVIIQGLIDSAAAGREVKVSVPQI